MALRNPHFRLFAGAFLISFSPVFVRLVSVSPTASGFWRTLIGGVALSLWIVLARQRRWPGRLAWGALGAAAAFFAFDLWFWHRSILLIGPGLSTLLANLQVFFMIAAGIVLFRERPRPMQILAALLAVVGLALVLGRDWFDLAPGYRAGVMLGMLTALSYAGYLLSLKRARRDVDDPLPAVEVAIVSLVVASLLGVAVLVEGNSLAVTGARDFGWLLAYGVLAHACGWLLIASSLTVVTAAQVGLALLLQPALSMVWDVSFFGRTLSVIEFGGLALTLLAIFLGSQRKLS